ncbi:MAG: KH domain-containing protein [Armatimonadetes bacterium]|nr:KH domain-containing protein [Armatimonadota bacterium]
MDSIEIIATSEEEALSQAATALGVPADSVKLAKIEETKGLFGKPGKIKYSATAAKAKAAKAPKAAKPEPVVEAAPAPEPAAKPEKPARAAKAKPAKKEEAPAAAAAEAPEARPEVVATQEDADNLVAILNDLMAKANLHAEATVASLNGRYVNLEIDGQDVSYVVGRRGEVLNALQYLLNVVSSRKLQNGVRVVLEGDSYRQRREAILTQMAIDIATEVKKRGEEAVLDALPAFERRVIHQALVEMEGINTYSEGEEPERRVVIAPAV